MWMQLNREGMRQKQRETRAMVIPAKHGPVPKVVMLSKALRGTLDLPRKKIGR